MADNYREWLNAVADALRSINMPMEEWQKTWRFDFEAEHRAGINPTQAAEKANRFWWSQQNKVMGQECRKTPNCWLPRNHQGECQPIS